MYQAFSNDVQFDILPILLDVLPNKLEKDVTF